MNHPAGYSKEATRPEYEIRNHTLTFNPPPPPSQVSSSLSYFSFLSVSIHIHISDTAASISPQAYPCLLCCVQSQVCNHQAPIGPKMRRRVHHPSGTFPNPPIRGSQCPDSPLLKPHINWYIKYEGLHIKCIFK